MGIFSPRFVQGEQRNAPQPGYFSNQKAEKKSENSLHVVTTVEEEVEKQPTKRMKKPKLEVQIEDPNDEPP